MNIHECTQRVPIKYGQNNLFTTKVLYRSEEAENTTKSSKKGRTEGQATELQCYFQTFRLQCLNLMVQTFSVQWNQNLESGQKLGTHT